MAGKSLLLLQGGIQRMTILTIPDDVQRLDDHTAVLGNGDRYLTPELIFFMFFPFTDA